jgi:hypothetical protein
VPDQQGDWRNQYEAFLWRPRLPLDVKFEVEKATGVLLDRDPGSHGLLTFRGSSSVPPNQYTLELRYEAALPERNLYSLRVDSASPKQWYSEEQSRRDADRAIAYWTGLLQLIPNPGAQRAASRELYEQRVAQTIGQETQRAGRREDPDPIRAVQREVLDGLRRGLGFRTAHHEGGTNIYLRGGKLIKANYGEDESVEEVEGEEKILASIRAFYDWESRRDTYPHRPPELEVWKYIRKELRK